MAGARYAVLIASSTFPSEPRLQALTAPEQDVDGLKAALLSPDRGCFSEVKVLKNRPHYEIASSIHRLFKLAKKDDLVMVYYSGHGKLNQAGDLYLTATDTNLDELESSAIGVVRIREFLNGSQSKLVVIILDCCFSGAISGVFSKGSLDDQLGVEASKARGTYIMTASTGIQTALQKEGDQYSVFTKHLIAGIETGEADTNRNGVITVEELYDYLYPRVCQESHQEPTRWNVDTRGHLIIANSGRQPRKEREKELRDLLLRLAKEQRIDNQILMEALDIISRPTENLLPADKEHDALLDDLHDEKIGPVSFLLKWSQIKEMQGNKGVGSLSYAGKPASETTSPKEGVGTHLMETGGDRLTFPIGYLIAGVALVIVVAYVLNSGLWSDSPPVVSIPPASMETETGSITESITDAKKSDHGTETSGNTGKANVPYQKAAERGNPDSQYNLGMLYHKGEDITKNDAKAVDWFRKAAQQGHAAAQIYLGLMYEEGNGVTKDYAIAMEWYRKAAQQGDATAQYNLGRMYEYGVGVTKDYPKAMEWYRKAAEQGDGDAQRQLAAME